MLVILVFLLSSSLKYNLVDIKDFFDILILILATLASENIVLLFYNKPIFTEHPNSVIGDKYIGKGYIKSFLPSFFIDLLITLVFERLFLIYLFILGYMINFATIGSNFIVENILKTVVKMDGYNYYGAYSRSIEKANYLKEKFGAEISFDNLSKMLEDEKINLVYIASPNSLHYEQAKMCLLANKNIICEKPFFTNTKELDDLIKISDDKKLFLFEAISIKYLPSLNILKSLLRKIGKISTCMINYSQYSSRFDKYKAGIVENIFKSEFSAGALADLGIYNLHLIYELFGMGEEFSYFGNINDYGVDISGSGIISYRDFTVSFTNAKNSKSENYIIVQGEEGYIKVYGNIQEAEKIEIFKDGKSEFIDIKKERDLYFYEFAYFMEIFKNKDYESSKEKLSDSKNVLKMFENLKKSGNIKDSYNMVDPNKKSCKN